MLCANCGKDLEVTDVYTFYYGSRKGSYSASSGGSIKTTTTYNIAGKHDVQLCVFCVLSYLRKSYFRWSGALFVFWAFIFFTFIAAKSPFILFILTVLPFLGVCFFLVRAILIASVINKNDVKAAEVYAKKQQETEISKKEYYNYGCKLAIDVMRSKLNNYDSFFTPNEFSILQ
jgi:hypothetical protein